MSKKKHLTCKGNAVYKSININYTYSLFSKDNGKDDAKLSTTTKYTKKGYNTAKKKAAEYALYSVCVSYSSGLYQCPGHRDAVDVGIKHMTFAPDYNAGDVLNSAQPENIRLNLQLEISERKRHALYKTQQLYGKGPYVRGQLVHHDLPTSMALHLGNLNNFINSASNVAPKLNGGHGDYKHKGPIYGFSGSAYRSNTYINLPMTVLSGKVTLPNDLKPMLPNISVDYNDCVCYSDCIAHGTLRVKYCTCNINCMCNYK